MTDKPTTDEAAAATSTAPEPETQDIQPAAGMPSAAESGGQDTSPPWWRRKAVIVVAAVVVLLGIAYGITYLMAGGKLARNATVAGIDVGGLSPAEASAKLEAELPEIVDVPIQLHLADTEEMFNLQPSEAGLTIDIPATVAAVPGGSADPVSLVKALFGGDDVEPTPAVDAGALRAALEAIAERANTEPVNGAVAFEEGEVVTSEPVVGTSLDVDGAVDVITGAFFGDNAQDPPIENLTVPMSENPPKVTAAEVERAVNEFAQPAMSGPVIIVAGDESVDLSPETIGQVLTLKPDEGGTLQPDLNGKKLVELAGDELEEIGQEGKDATVRIENGQPVVVPAQAGQGVDTSTLAGDVLQVLTKEGDDRQVEVELVDVDPELTTEAAEKLGVKEVVSEFTTQFPEAHYRDVNIGRAAELIDNTFLEPGDEFSLNGIVGERTEANGFTSGTIINQGLLEESMGGGVSQVATTTFHAAYKAGLEDVEHWPHSIYFTRYPLAEEATVAWGSKDLRFVNDTPYGVLVDTSFTASAGRGQGEITVRIWSTEHFKVETSLSEKSNFTSPRTIYDSSANCQAHTGHEGFTITAYRKVWNPDGELVKDEADPWTYNPNHNVVCGREPNGG